MDPGKTLVIIPTYNEADNLGGIVGRVRAAVPAVDVLITDDNSPDGTGQLADRLGEHDTAVHVLHRQYKQGLGAAYLDGFGWGIDRGYDLLVEMDADGSHHPEQLPTLLQAAMTADLVLGSRWVSGGSVQNWSASRKLISRCGNVWARLALGIRLRDATGGYRVFRRSTLQRIGLDDVASAGYCFQLDLAWRAVRGGFRVREVPITFTEREHGRSKMNRQIVAEALLRTTLWGARHRLDQLRALSKNRSVRRPRPMSAARLRRMSAPRRLAPAGSRMVRS
jgi:dolichol-phosphate mannosyltransferase